MSRLLLPCSSPLPTGRCRLLWAKYAFTRGIQDIGAFFTVFAVFTALSRLITGKIGQPFWAGRSSGACRRDHAASQLTLFLPAAWACFCWRRYFTAWRWAVIQPTLNTIFVIFSAPERKGRAIAVYYSSVDIASALVRFCLAGYHKPLASRNLYVHSVCCLITLAVYFLFLRSRLLKYEVNFMIRRQALAYSSS